MDHEPAGALTAMGVPAWPALAGATGQLPFLLSFSQAVWGKAHGASSDYRWIATSPGFDNERPELPGQLSLGPEDEPRKAVHWRALSGRYLAMSSYPSRAVDAFGRRGSIEKQMLEWAPETALPAALGALALLPLAERQDDGIWWQSRGDRRWGEARFRLEVRPADSGCCQLAPGGLGDLLGPALAAARASFAPDELALAYSELLAGHRPAILGGCSAPPPAAALAALLLPLARPLADQVSLAGWIPSRHAVLAELGDRWDLVVAEPPAGSRRTPTEPGRALAAALLNADPIRLTPGRRPGPPRGEPVLPVRTLELAPSPPPGLPLGSRLYSFACQVDARWLPPERLAQDPADRDGCGQGAAALVACIAAWVPALAQARPAYVDLPQWQVKLDLLWAAAIALGAGPQDLERIGGPRGGQVPGLLYAPVLVAPAAADRWCRLDADRLAGLIGQGLNCANLRQRESIREWLQAWAAQSTHPWLRELCVRQGLGAARTATPRGGPSRPGA